MLRQRLVFVGLLLALCLGLAGCLQALQTGELRTATPGEPAGFGVSPTAATGIATAALPAEATQAPAQPGATELPPATQVPATQPPAPTLAPTATAAPTATPLPTVEVVRPSLNSEQIWRSQQQDREPFPEVRAVRAPGKLLLWWFDPVAQQHVALGWIGPEFQTQARFRLAGSWVEALEVPYQVNQSYGLVLTDAVLARMRAAGYTTEGPEAWLETYVYAAPDLVVQ